MTSCSAKKNRTTQLEQKTGTRQEQDRKEHRRGTQKRNRGKGRRKGSKRKPLFACFLLPIVDCRVAFFDHGHHLEREARTPPVNDQQTKDLIKSWRAWTTHVGWSRLCLPGPLQTLANRRFYCVFPGCPRRRCVPSRLSRSTVPSPINHCGNHLGGSQVVIYKTELIA